ncbi:thiamine-triphosphatase isoform X2 [Lampris incognitus]|uniref:thiamine-triphosphatase isoform X2 n=1 Tax=Lampris incognitus TaxID=2546036 RepID=UPI0024B5F1C1|nr:thiamine-triphosphatase isoform X2 [Lampris incognitus]XP_056155696.1 thiamine-triphosphatase isoform X2 [Lampris incognitus]
MSVEVERKFVCHPDILKTLEGIGVCNVQRQFHDRYFDTPNFDLTLNDMWLRKREGCWELKCPTTMGSRPEDTSRQQPKEAALCTRYKEINDLLEIQQKLREVLKESLTCGQSACQLPEKVIEERKSMTEVGCQNKGEPNINKYGPETAERDSSDEDDAWLSKLNLVCFAEFTTVRHSFIVEEGVQIDLDQADFGYYVGEIEVMVHEGEDVSSALEKIGKVAAKLGLTGDQRVQGKMDVYLQRYCPEHYTKLRSAHVL